MTTVTRRYSFKLYPTHEQSVELTRQCHMVGDLWNALLQRQEDTYRRWQAGLADKKRLTFFDMTGEITAMRRACPEWADLSVWTAHRTAKALDEAFAAFFRRAKQGAGKQAGYPRYRPRRLQTWLPHRAASGFKVLPDQREGLRRQLHWRVKLKAVPGEIGAMGRFPAAPVAWKHADIRWRDGAWWLSVCVEIPPDSRRGGVQPNRPRSGGPTEVRFDLIDCMAAVDGEPTPAWMIGLDLDDSAQAIADLQRRLAEEKRGSDEWCELKRRVAREHARAARQRREALHVWTTQIVRSASALRIVRPPSIKDATASGRGGEREWGAAVQTKAEINRTVLGQAPGMACQMLAYKAAEAGIKVEDVAATTEVAVGDLLVSTAKQARRARRAAKKAKELEAA